MPSGPADAVVAYAQRQLGKPYVWGGEGEYDGTRGYDCSGLVYAAYRAAGLVDPGQPGKGRTTAAVLGTMGASVPLERAVPGDVLYFDNPGPTDHVGIFIGNGQMIEAPTIGQNVKVSKVRQPTSVRRFPGVFGRDDAGRTGGAGTAATVETGGAGGAVGGALGSLNPLGTVSDLFATWQDDVVGIGLKITAAGVVGCLFIVGAREAFAEKGGRR